MSFKRIHNVLSDNILDRVIQQFCYIKDTDRSSYEVWPDEATGNKTLPPTWSEQITDNTKSLILDDLYNSPQSPLYHNKLIKHSDLAVLKYPPGSCCPFHYDTALCAMTIFLNKEWQDDWGGHFQYVVDDVLHSVPPKANSGVYALYDELTQGAKHGASTVTGKHIRYVLQLFMRKPDLSGKTNVRFPDD